MSASGNAKILSRSLANQFQKGYTSPLNVLNARSQEGYLPPMPQIKTSQGMKIRQNIARY